MAGPSFIQAMIEALRTKPNPERRVYKNGQLYRTEPVPDTSISGAIQGQQKKVQYGRYVTMQHQMGEEPVSYEEWLGSQ